MPRILGRTFLGFFSPFLPPWPHGARVLRRRPWPARCYFVYGGLFLVESPVLFFRVGHLSPFFFLLGRASSLFLVCRGKIPAGSHFLLFVAEVLFAVQRGLPFFWWANFFCGGKQPSPFRQGFESECAFSRGLLRRHFLQYGRLPTHVTFSPRNAFFFVGSWRTRVLVFFPLSLTQGPREFSFFSNLGTGFFHLVFFFFCCPFFGVRPLLFSRAWGAGTLRDPA